MRNTERHRRSVALGAVAAALLAVAACGGSAGGSEEAIAVSGSSTVAPITRAVATAGGFAVDVAAEGTTDGFARFCAGETAINNASTPIPGAGQRVDYVQLCADHGVEFIELPVALDALSVIRNEANAFATELTLAELRAIWEPGSTVTTWADVRPGWPDQPVGLYGRGEGSGTFEVFTHVVNGTAGEIRDDYRATDDLAELAGWIAEDEHGLGWMGVGNYLAADEEDRDRITNVAVDGVQPSLADVQAGRYDAFTRPLLVYVSVAALEDEAVAEFVEYYLDEVAAILPRVYFYALPVEAYPLVRQRLEQRITGTMYDGDPFSAATVLDVLGRG